MHLRSKQSSQDSAEQAERDFQDLSDKSVNKVLLFGCTDLAKSLRKKCLININSPGKTFKLFCQIISLQRSGENLEEEFLFTNFIRKLSNHLCSRFSLALAGATSTPAYLIFTKPWFYQSSSVQSSSVPDLEFTTGGQKQ